ncbi:MAG: hypothetical protein ACEY3J_02860 [Arsenophonus sp.]
MLKHRMLHNLLLSNNYAYKSKAIDRFMLVLSTIYNLNKQAFFSESKKSNQCKDRHLFC